MLRVDLELRAIGPALRNLRGETTQQSASEKGLAAGAKCTISSIYNWEKGNRFPGVDTLLKYVKGLGYTSQDFWAEVERVVAELQDGAPQAIDLEDFAEDFEERLKQDPALRASLRNLMEKVEASEPEPPQRKVENGG